MKHIDKLPPPKSFVEFCAKPHSFYDSSDFPKDDLRQNLLAEQGYICCYCMKRIPESTSPFMKVEHFKCQERYSYLQLTYTNLLGACTGNLGQPIIKQTCDTKKGSQDITISLISNAPNCETLFRYNAEGEISSINNNEEINLQLNDILNLNMQTLKDGRREIYLEVQKKVEADSRQIGNRQLKIKFFERERNNWLSKIGNKYRPFCMVAVYYLNKKIRQFKT